MQIIIEIEDPIVVFNHYERRAKILDRSLKRSVTLCGMWKYLFLVETSKRDTIKTPPPLAVIKAACAVQRPK